MVVSRCVTSGLGAAGRWARALGFYLAGLATLGVVAGYALEPLTGALARVAASATGAPGGADVVTASAVLDAEIYAQQTSFKKPAKPKTSGSAAKVKAKPASPAVKMPTAAPASVALSDAGVVDQSVDAEQADDLATAPKKRSASTGSQSLATYRTMCVRLCDGYYFPISYATTPDHFAKDEAKCEASCAGPVRLYVYENPGADPLQMEDLSGEPYAELKTADLFRTEYVPSCSCKAAAWEQEAQDRHRVYALEAERGDLQSRIAANQRIVRKGSGKKRGKKGAAIEVAAANITTDKAAVTAVDAEIAQLKQQIDVSESSRKEAAVAAVTAKGVSVASIAKSKKKRFASHKKRPAKTAAPPLVAAVADNPAIAAPGAEPPPATWGPPMGLGAGKSKGKPKIWGNGPNAHGAPRGGGAHDVFRSNFF